MPFRKKPSRNVQKSNNRRPAPRRRNVKRRTNMSHVHLFSERQHTITLKGTHRIQELYPVPLSDLYNAATVGSDTDIRVVGYRARLSIPTGNNLSSASCAVSHSGPWTRSTPGDGFNQKIAPRYFSRNGTMSFNRTVLPTSERQYTNPITDPTNTIDFKITDVAGLLPGAMLVINITMEVIRPHIERMVTNPTTSSKDAYIDQDVSGSGASPSPPSSFSDIPAYILDVNGNILLPDQKLKSPFTFVTKGGVSFPSSFTVNATIPPFNFVGSLNLFTNAQASNLQTEYTKEGFEGTITAN